MLLLEFCKVCKELGRFESQKTALSFEDLDDVG